MADLPGATATPEDGQVPLDVSPVTAGQGDQYGSVSGVGTAEPVTTGAGSGANPVQAPPPLSTPAGHPSSVPSPSTTPYRPAYSDAQATPAPSTIPAGVPPGVFTPGPSAGSWVYTPYPAPVPDTGSQVASAWAGQPVYPAQGFSQGSPQNQTSGAGTSKEHARKTRRRRHHRRRRGSSGSSSSSSTGTESSGERYETPTRRHLVEFSFPAHQVGDVTLNRVTDWGNYRLENQDQAYTRKMAKKMASLNRRMQPSFGGHPKFSGKKPALIFAFLRRFVKACNDNDISEGKALYLMVNFMTGEAEQRFAQVLPDSAGHVVGRTVGSYPEAVNWLLSNYADADSLRKAVGKLNRATMERQEAPDTFARRVRELSEACGNVYPEDRLKMIFSEGLPEYLQVDAENYNQEHQEHTFQQLMAYTQGKYRQAKALQVPVVTTPLKTMSRARPGGDRSKETEKATAVLAVGEATPEEAKPSGPTWGGFVSKERGSLVSPKGVGNRRFRACWLCQQADHLSYQCPMVPKDLQEKLRRQGLVFAKAVGWADRQSAGRGNQVVHATRVATLQSITEALSKDAPGEFDLEPEVAEESTGSGNE